MGYEKLLCGSKPSPYCALLFNQGIKTKGKRKSTAANRGIELKNRCRVLDGRYI